MTRGFVRPSSRSRQASIGSRVRRLGRVRRMDRDRLLGLAAVAASTAALGAGLAQRLVA